MPEGASTGQTTPALSRQEKLVAQRAEEILDVAIRVFSAQGFAQADVQQIADDAGVGKGTVYRHFGNKEGLFLAAAGRGLQRLKESIDTEVDSLADPLEQLKVATRAFLAFFDAHSEILELVIQERAHFRDRTTPTFFGPRTDERAQRWRERMLKLTEQGIVRDLPVEQIIDTVGKFLYGAVFVNYFGRHDKTLSQQGDQIVDALFYGILAPRKDGCDATY
jgi:AcrR family transcriptional regulator